MKWYWLHVASGTEVTGFGPFATEEEHREFRAIYADDEDESGARRNVDDIPPLPGVNDRDDHESDTWIALVIDRHGEPTPVDSGAIYGLRRVSLYEIVD